MKIKGIIAMLMILIAFQQVVIAETTINIGMDDGFVSHYSYPTFTPTRQVFAVTIHTYKERYQ